MEGAMLSLLLAIVASVLPTGFAVECYVCSWSPDDVNRTDLCGEEDFSPMDAYKSNCPLGCETYTQWDLNGVLEQYRRNCYQGESPASGDCESTEGKAIKSERCTCNWDLCNSSISWISVQPLFLVMNLVALLLWSCVLQLVVI